MAIFSALFPPQSAAWSVFLLALVACAGLAAGNVKFFGVKFGIAAVMFSGIFFSWLGLAMNPAMLALFRDFGLILFVYSIGAQVGPGFFASFRSDGLKLNLMLRELGIVLFFSCVGLECGAKFVDTVMHGNGLQVMLLASLISIVPAFAAAYFFKLRYKVNFMTLCGALTGATTNPPALAFSDTFARPGLNTMAYATVYPLAMLMRIVSAQLILLLFR